MIYVQTVFSRSLVVFVGRVFAAARTGRGLSLAFRRRRGQRGITFRLIGLLFLDTRWIFRRGFFITTIFFAALVARTLAALGRIFVVVVSVIVGPLVEELVGVDALYSQQIFQFVIFVPKCPSKCNREVNMQCRLISLVSPYLTSQLLSFTLQRFYLRLAYKSFRRRGGENFSPICHDPQLRLSSHSPLSTSAFMFIVRIRSSSFS